MSEELLKKQVKLDDLSCEKAALTARLRASQQRVAKLEKQAQALSEHGAELGGMGSELSAGGGFGSDGMGTPSKGAGGMRRRGGGGGRSGIAAIPAVAKYEEVRQAADKIDGWALWLMGIVRANPYARLYFLLYLGTLHSWIFFITVFHATSFEEVHGDHVGVGVPGMASNSQFPGVAPNTARALGV